MARPLRGQLKPLPDGRCQASLPVERGSTKRRSFTFPTSETAQAWLDAGVAALEAGRPLPEAKTFLRPRTRLVQPTYATGGPTLRQLAYDYHRTNYLDNHRAKARRTKQVLKAIELHILPFFDGIDVHHLDELTPALIVNFTRFMGGWPLTGGLAHTGDRRPPMERSTATNQLRVLQRILQYAVTCGHLERDPSVGITAMELYGGSRKKPHRELLTLQVAAEIAQYLAPPHQLTLWMERLLGVRAAEAFGVRVRDVADFGDYGLITVMAQGGGTFEVRDEYGRFVTVPHKDEVKRDASRRVMWAPPALMELIRIIVEAFHTDPETGEVRSDARLIPGIRADDTSGAQTFALRLGEAAAHAGHGDDDVVARLTPQHLRRSIATDLEMNEVSEAVFRRLYLGHRAGDDVLSRHYLLDDPRHQKLKDIAARTEDEVRAAIGDLIVPTSATLQWGRQTRTRANLDHIERVLIAYDWFVPADADADADEEDPIWSTTRIARELDIAPGTARRWLREGVIESETYVWGTRLCHGARRSVVEAYRQARDARLTLDGVADDLGMGYHEAYQMLIRLGHQPEALPGERRLEITDDHATALREECERLRLLHRRAVRSVDAAKLLGRSRRSVDDWVDAGKLDVDPETDSSGSRFITRASIEAHLPEPPASSAPVDEVLSQAEVAALTGLALRQVKALVDGGRLTTVKVGRAGRVTRASLIDWATGYRPELLDILTDLGERT